MINFFRQKLQLCDRRIKQSLMFVTDIIILLLAAWLAYALRSYPNTFVPNSTQLLLIIATPLLATPIFIRMGLYRSVIRYLSEQAAWTIFKAIALLALFWTALGFFMLLGGKSWDGLPRTVPILFFCFAFLMVTFSRLVARWIIWTPLQRQVEGKQVLIYGANESGFQLAQSLRQSKEMFPAGFLDDDPKLHGKDLGGIRVYPPTELMRLQQLFGIHDVIVNLHNSSTSHRRQVVKALENQKIRVRILPTISDIASGKHLVNLIREIDIGDLLGRSKVQADPDLLDKCIRHKTVLVTGAAGSIGSELCQQIILHNPQCLILFDHNEHALYELERNLKNKTSASIIPRLGSVKNKMGLSSLLGSYNIHTIYHAAAYKHVTLVENNANEGIKNNVFGTWNLAETAFKQGVETFVLISTDKAVRPTNIMGATKRWAELGIQYFAALAQQQNTGQRFCAVRFGNVLGSSGSVIPLFREQIAQGGPVTVTDPEVIRYFMSVHEAVELVIQAGSLATGGDVFLLDMGDPVRIYDLAKDMIELAGYSVKDAEHTKGDIEIVFTGLRAGEKLYEELLILGDHVSSTEHPKIMRGAEPFPGVFSMENFIKTLENKLQNNDSDLQEFLMTVALNQWSTLLAHKKTSSNFISNTLH